MQSTTKAFLQLHAAVFLAGFTGILGRLIELNEAWLVWYRMLLASFMLLVLMWIRKKSIAITRQHALACIGVGILIALHWVFFYGSIKFGNVSVALVCFAATGSFTAVLEPLLLKRRIDWMEIALGLLVLFGIWLMFHLDVSYKTAVLLGLAAAFLSALFPIFNKQLIRNVEAPVLTLYELSGGWLLLTMLLPFYFTYSPAAYFIPTWSDVFWLLVLSFFCTVVAFQLSVAALRHISPFTANLTYNLEPVYGIALAFLLFGEQRELGKGFFGGVVCILLSVLLQTVRIKRQQNRSGKSATASS